MPKPDHDFLPRPARVALYVVSLVMLAAQPFVLVYAGEELSQAFIVSASVLGAAAGVSALTHPTKTNTEQAREAYETGFNDAYWREGETHE